MIQKIIYKLCVLFFVFVLAACNTATTQKKISPAEKSAASSAFNLANERGIEGTWEGLILQGAALTYIKMELSPAQKSAGSWQYTGKAYAQSFDGYIKGYSVTQDIQTENVEILATYDPLVRTFHFQARPGGRPGRLGMHTHLRNIGGVYDQRKGALAGLRQSRVMGRNTTVNTGNQYFLFLRPDPFEDAAKTFKRLKKSSSPGGISKIAKSAQSIFAQFSRIMPSGGPSKNTLREWVKPLYDEYPDMDLYRSAYGHFELIAIKLFRDHHFEKYLDDPFDQLSAGELANIQGAFINLRKSRNMTDRSTSVLERMFWTGRGDNAAMQTALWVKAHRHMLNWRKDCLKKLAKLPGRKDSLLYTDRFEKELEKTASTLLWSSELTQDKQNLADARQRIAFPALKAMLADFKTASKSPSLMNQLATWQTTEKRLFSYLSQEQSRGLLNAAEKRLNNVIAHLLPPYDQRISSMGTGLDAVNNGNAWFTDFTGMFAKVIKNNQVLQILADFKQERRDHLHQAQDEMLAQIQQGFDRLSPQMSKSADAARVSYLTGLKQTDRTWFAVPGDGDSPATRTVRAAMDKLGGQATGYLPPRLARRTGFVSWPLPPTDKPYNKLYSSKVDPLISKTGILADSDELVRTVMPKPIRDAKFKFNSNIVWALFHGRFDELDSRYYTGQGIGSDITSKYFGKNPRFHYAFITYAGLSSKEHGKKQIGPTSQVFWNRTKGGEVIRKGFGKIYISTPFFQYYERSYKLATKVSSTDAMWGKNGFQILQTMMDFGSGRGFQKSGVRPDGELQIARAGWEYAIYEDLRILLEKWPQQSYGLWQLQENIARYLKGRPSLQALYNYRS
ncbi:MAG: hypothetical protein BBJ57_00740 [Desulfobacterales bacterium PC51MH44]|nr:MAG: hypothetical protein BBJ57_00740 [Desulfobacterales bacterium PC51MH44]